MDLKTGKRKKKVENKFHNERCIYCGQSCSMSGLCMKPWPGFSYRIKTGGADDGKNSKKSG